jgi:signal transduction histidine kinase
MMPLDRWWFHSAKKRLSLWLLQEIVHAQLEPILHPSANRLLWIGWFTFLGHLTFGWIWGVWLPQPYENPVARVVLALLAAIYVLPATTREPSSGQSGLLFGVATWIQLPWFFTWMYCMNGGDSAWLASLTAMILIYFHATDWRLASVGLMSGGIAGWLTAVATQDPGAAWSHPAANWVVLAFASGMGLMLGLSSANLRRTRLINTLSAIGVMAHELRTPLATVNLMGDVLRTLARNDPPEHKSRKIDDLATRLQNLVRSMNRQIDTQISNAQLMRLPREPRQIDATDLVNEVIKNYPYQSSRERDCVRLHVQSDFSFLGSRALFAQVLTNLLKNALHSLASASSAPKPGGLRLDVGLHQGKGRIAVSDHGVGIGHEQKARIFEPFFSTQSGVGHGLGLTFCKNVVEAANGSISVRSEPAMGAVFMIDLPLHLPPTDALRPA